MKVIILAAGRGKRLDIPEKNKLPKCLLKIKNNETILELNLKNILSLNEIERVSIVTGFKHELVEEYVLSRYSGNKIEFIFNSNFTETVIYSVRSGFANISKDRHILLINGDTLFNKNTFKKASEICFKNDSSITIFGCTANEVHQDDMKLLVHNDIAEKIGKNIEKANAISSGAILFCNDGVDKYSSVLKSEFINNFRTHHEILEFICRTGYKISFSDSYIRDWLEIDTKEDLLFATSQLIN